MIAPLRGMIKTEPQCFCTPALQTKTYKGPPGTDQTAVPPAPHSGRRICCRERTMEETKFGITLYNVTSPEEYWCRLERDLETYLVRLLQGKNEYGTSELCSERGVQAALVCSARSIARQQGLDPHKTACICLAVGLCFPPFGSYGLAACRNYLAQNGSLLPEPEWWIGAVEYVIDRDGTPVTPQLHAALCAYYANQTHDPEVNVARYCQRLLGECRQQMKDGAPAGEVLTAVTERAAAEFSLQASLLPQSEPPLSVPPEVQQQTDAALAEFIGFFGLPDGLFEYVTG